MDICDKGGRGSAKSETLYDIMKDVDLAQVIYDCACHVHGAENVADIEQFRSAVNKWGKRVNIASIEPLSTIDFIKQIEDIGGTVTIKGETK